MVVAFRKEMLAGQTRFATPAFDRPEERISEETREFDIRGNHNTWEDQKRPGDTDIIYTQPSSRTKKDRRGIVLRSDTVRP